MTDTAPPEGLDGLTLDTIRWLMFVGLDQYALYPQVSDAFWTVVEAIDALEEALEAHAELRCQLTTSGGVAAS